VILIALTDPLVIVAVALALVLPPPPLIITSVSDVLGGMSFSAATSTKPSPLKSPVIPETYPYWFV
jgi:hypothetical protein